MLGLSKSANRFFIGSLVIGVLIGALLVYFGARFFSLSIRNQDDGIRFGKGRSQQECVDEALRRHTPSIDPTVQVSESAFVTTCLNTSNPDEHFCTDVPEFSLLNQIPVKSWAETKCSEKGFTDGGCTGIFVQIASHCQLRKDQKRKNQ